MPRHEVAVAKMQAAETKAAGAKPEQELGTNQPDDLGTPFRVCETHEKQGILPGTFYDER